MDDQELFDSVTSHEPTEVVDQAQAEPAAEVNDGQPRDEQGKFASQQQAEHVDPNAAQQRDEAHIPSWRLREQTERAEAAELRAQQIQSDFERRFNELQSRLPKQEPQQAPDIFEDPNKFLEHGVRQAVDPVRSEVGQMREFYSRRDAVRDHGEEKVNAAYDAIAKGLQSRDPEVATVYQRAMSSMDPYGDIVKWHQQKTVYSQIGNDPEAWFNKQLEERMAKDPNFQAKLLGQTQQQIRNPSGSQPANIVKLPPSLSKVGAATTGSNVDLSDAELFDEVTSARR